MNKRIFWMFRTDLKNLEYYHLISDLETFEKECHDFYLLMPLFFLKNNDFDEVIIWRLYDDPKEDIVFEVNGKKFIQRWVKDFNECFNHERPTISFFRGGFEVYCELTKKYSDFFGLKLYLGSSKRVIPKFGGIYDKILVEDDFDIFQYKGIPFYKTANTEIFKPLDRTPSFNICWIANFTQLKHKGQDFFIRKVSDSTFLSQQKIIHIGNRPDVGKELCNRYNVHNIIFSGYHSRPEINELLNISKYGLVTSNLEDGCPRVLTEIMMSGIPLIKRKETRLLNYYKEYCVEFSDEYLESTIKNSDLIYNFLKNRAIDILPMFSIETICKKNLELWQEK